MKLPLGGVVVLTALATAAPPLSAQRMERDTANDVSILATTGLFTAALAVPLIAPFGNGYGGMMRGVQSGAMDGRMMRFGGIGNLSTASYAGPVRVRSYAGINGLVDTRPMFFPGLPGIVNPPSANTPDWLDFDGSSGIGNGGPVILDVPPGPPHTNDSGDSGQPQGDVSQPTVNAVTPTTTPEPVSLGLMATGLLGVFGVARRRRRA